MKTNKMTVAGFLCVGLCGDWSNVSGTALDIRFLLGEVTQVLRYVGTQRRRQGVTGMAVTPQASLCCVHTKGVGPSSANHQGWLLPTGKGPV